MPSVTWPKAAYWPSRYVLSVWTIKNWELALFLSLERAMETVPRTWEMGFSTPFSANSPTTVSSEPPVPSPLGSPPWIMKPSMMRWKVRPS